MSALTNLLANDGYIIVNKVLIRKLGLECATLIGELCSEYSYWEKHNKLENGFFILQEKIYSIILEFLVIIKEKPLQS